MKEICGDISATYRPGWRLKLRYLVENFVRGVHGYGVSIHAKAFVFSGGEATSDSVGRQYINAFLNQELAKLTKSKALTVLDVGCGSGYVRDMLVELGYVGEYTGLDVVRDTRYKESNSPFVSSLELIKIEECKTEKRFDLVISNTALEHIEDDVAAVRKCAEFTAPHGVQIHIVPAFCSLFAYLLHGYRQYTPKRIDLLFSGQENTVWKLGGFASFILQIFWCTIPERLTGSDRMRRTSLYRLLVRTARRLDRVLPFCSLLYAVVVTEKHEH